MYVVIVEIEIANGAVVAFMEHMFRQAKTSLESEPDCLQFDVCIESGNPENVLLYEVYKSEAAFKAHLEAPYFASFDAAVQPLMARKTVRIFERTDT